jgi:glycosyltransferase involved in cell wall biosynthesis
MDLFMIDPKSISVIIPTFNRGHLIKDAVESIRQQDIKGYSIEIIVIDDGSTDNTKEILQNDIDEKKIYYIYQQNKGAGAARNKGISVSHGNWITFLDSDDRWLPFHLSLQIAVLEQISSCKVLFSDCFVVTTKGIRIKNGLDLWAQSFNNSKNGEWKRIFSEKFDSTSINVRYQGEAFQIYKGNIFKQILFQACMPCWTTIIARECFTTKVRFAEDLPTWEDFWFSCQLAENNDIYFMDFCTVENRGHSGPRLTQANLITRTKCYIDICTKIYFKSLNDNRPSDIELIGLFLNLNKTLFKEYIKSGMHHEAAEVKKTLDTMNTTPKDIKFTLYYLSYFIPGKLVNRIVRLKRLLFGF